MEPRNAPRAMSRLESAMNYLTDIDAGWWPFVRLRPARHERMDNARLLKIALHFGPLYGLLVFAWYVFIEFVPLSALWAAVCVLVSVAFLFIAYKVTFAIYWNRRAERLQRDGQEGKSQCP
jgi:hypothetical protein